MEAFILNDEQLQQRLVYWQEKLNLLDWKIEAKIKRANHMRENCAGAVNWTMQKKMATIAILDPIDYPDDVMGEQDMENTLVHELLHLHLAPMNDDYSENEHYILFEEWAINSIAGALIAVERK